MNSISKFLVFCFLICISALAYANKSNYHLGTAIFITSTGIAVTAAHVVDGTTDNRIYYRGEICPVQILYINIDTDIAIVRAICTGPIVYVEVESEFNNDRLEEGSQITYSGYGGMSTFLVNSTTKRGLISNIDDDQTEAIIEVNHGDSGSGILNKNGRLIGIMQDKSLLLPRQAFFGGLDKILEGIRHLELKLIRSPFNFSASKLSYLASGHLEGRYIGP
jgi:hypothetical protein